MSQSKPANKVDPKEFELPETTFVRDIENRVFQSILLQCLAKVEGIGLVEGGFIDNILGRDSLEGVKGIHINQDNKNHSVAIRVEVNVGYGIPIPEKAEEIQSKVVEEVTRLTGLHVSSVHVVFKNLIMPTTKKGPNDQNLYGPGVNVKDIESHYSEEF